jgi:hypothetical protein
MNAYKLNGIVGHICRDAICKELKINHTDIYKEVRNIDSNGTITTKDGKKYELVLKEKEIV